MKTETSCWNWLGKVGLGWVDLDYTELYVKCIATDNELSDQLHLEDEDGMKRLKQR